VKYTKQALPFPKQADQLIRRGLVADRAELIDRLRAVNYYRLSAYWHTFRLNGDPDERLAEGTTLASVWRVAPQSRWRDRFANLLAEYPDIPIRFMGFPENWQQSPLWSRPAAKAKPAP
jgi:abortive infection bacteriophage resistance protein